MVGGLEPLASFGRPAFGGDTLDPSCDGHTSRTADVTVLAPKNLGGKPESQTEAGLGVEKPTRQYPKRCGRNSEGRLHYRGGNKHEFLISGKVRLACFLF